LRRCFRHAAFANRFLDDRSLGRRGILGPGFENGRGFLVHDLRIQNRNQVADRTSVLV
jgi:hypothetical protein